MIRAITLWQPWSSFIADGLKTIETRQHNHFEPLVGERIAIHAGKKWDPNAFEIFDCPVYRGKGMPPEAMMRIYGKKNVPLGAIVCTAIVAKHERLRSEHQWAACIPIRRGDVLYGLFLEDIQKLETPIPACGSQGIWHFEGDLDLKGNMESSKQQTLF